LRAYITDCVHDAALADAIWMLFEGAITSALIVGAQAAQRAGDAAARLIAHQETP
ncbi:TetR/AcrR family transcriptional regulator, partial [Klebsiella oxytoca]